MRVFVTGATGHIGTAVVRDLLGEGHVVVGLARSDRSAAALTAAGAEAHRGDLADLDGLRSAAVAADGVVHLAYQHDFSDMQAAARLDLGTIETIGAALDGSGKPFVVTSGTLPLAMAAPGRAGTEEDVFGPQFAAVPRVTAENTAIALADRGVRSSVVRLAPAVHSTADQHGFLTRLIGIARDKGVSAFVGDGTNRWPGVHTLDAARLFRLAVESAPAGSRLHGAADAGVPFRDIADVIGRHLNLPVVAISRAEAETHFGFLAAIAALDNPTSSTSTRKQLGWNPEHPGLLADLDEGHYFSTAKASA